MRSSRSAMPVLPPLLMISVLAIGLISLAVMRREVFPEFELEIVLVSVPYPGASPSEVAEGVLLSTEEAVRGLQGTILTGRQALEKGLVDQLGGLDAATHIQLGIDILDVPLDCIQGEV